MKAISMISFFLLILSYYSFDFGQTEVKLTQLNGATATLTIYTTNSGNTSNSSLTINNLQLACESGTFYKLTCLSTTTLQLSRNGTEIQCSIEKSIPSSACVLLGKPSILSTGHTFNTNSSGVVPESSKFGKIQLELVLVEGKKTKIKIHPERKGDTSTDGLFIQDLTVNNKDLTCLAGKKLTLEPNTGTELECSTTEEIDANIECKLGGSPMLFSPGDSFDQVSINNKRVYSSFGIVKIGIISVKGTTITIDFQPEYKGKKKVDVTGLQINETRTLHCPETMMDLVKTGTQLTCTVDQAVEEGNVCLLTQNNLKSNALPNITINADKNNCTAKDSKFGKVTISPISVLGRQVIILIKPAFGGITEANQFIIDNLKLYLDNKDYPMTCSYKDKLTLSTEGTEFRCSIQYSINGGQECSLGGTPTFNSPGDTFSDISITKGSVFSSFGKIYITPISIIGNEVRIELSSEITGTTNSSIVSINNLKIGDKNLTCPIGVNINFREKPEYICTLNETMNGNILFKLRGDNPTIIKQENSKDIFGQINLYTNEIISQFGKLEINLLSVKGREVNISLKSQYIGNITDLNIYSLYLNNKYISCSSTGVNLILLDGEGNSNATILCYFDYSYSQQTNTSCTLTGTPSASKKLFTSIIINNNKVISGTRNFGETVLYLESIKGTTVNIKINPSLGGKVRPIINNVTLQAGSQNHNVTCNVAEQLQLYANQRVPIKCYIQQTINSNTECRLISEGVSISTDCGDLFGNVYIDSNSVTIKPAAPTFDNVQIKLTSIIGTQININIIVSSTAIISSIAPTIYNLKLNGSELYCSSSQYIYFTNNIAQMSCTSSSEITCGFNCELSGNPTIVSYGSEEATFGQAKINKQIVQAISSTLGNISIKLKEIIGNVVYLGVSSTNEGRNTQEVAISNLYVDGQQLTCIDTIKFSTTETRVKCTVKEAIPYNKTVTLTGTPSIRINSVEESIGLVALSDSGTNIITKSNSAIILQLISVKQNIVTISITAKDLAEQTLFRNFAVNGLAINNCPFELRLAEVSLSNNAYLAKVKLNETFEREVACSLIGVDTAQIEAEGSTFGPITNSASGPVYSTDFKFGEGTISLIYIQGYSVILRITSTKTAYTKNTEIKGLYINGNYSLTCQIKDDLEFNLYGTDVECKLSKAMNPGTRCTLSYKEEPDENFESLMVTTPYYNIYSTSKYFGDVTIGLKEVSGLNVKIFVKTAIQNKTTTDHVEIKNLYANNKELICEYDDYIEFISYGNILDCTLSSMDLSETFTLSGNDIQIISFADSFGRISIDNNNKTVRTSPKNIDNIVISLSSIAGNKAVLKLTTSSDVYTYLNISNLKIKNNKNSYSYGLSCPKAYINAIQKNGYTDSIKCVISTNISPGIYVSLINNKQEVIIESYDNFKDIIVDTSQITSTKFGNIDISYLSSSIALVAYPTNQETSLNPLYFYNIKLNTSFNLVCRTEEAIELKETGTVIYCNLEGQNFLDNAYYLAPYISSGEEHLYNNLNLRKESNNLKSPNCYAIYDKFLCALNNNCIFSKDSYGFCVNKINYTSNIGENNNQDNECILYLNEDACYNNEKCVWNVENKYTCKTKTIENSKKLNKLNSYLCEECNVGFELNSQKTQCISTGNTYYPCKEYTGYYTCNTKAQCDYHYESYYYCSNKDDSEEYNNCYLYLTQSACNSQAKCSWKYNDNSGCKEKDIQNCVKLKESDPTSCEQCLDGYYLIGKTCSDYPLNIEEQCNEFTDSEYECINLGFCEYSNRSFCYGENELCSLYLDQNLCENHTYQFGELESSNRCYWNPGNLERCIIKSIPNCLLLSSENAKTCSLCKEGYSLYDEGTACLKNNDVEESDKNNILFSCYEYATEEKSCKSDRRCKFKKRDFCESRYTYSYDYDNYQCYLYLDQTQCEENSECIWNTNSSITTCHYKEINNCAKLKSQDTLNCETCKEGYYLEENIDSTKCKKSKGNMIQVSLITFALIILLL